MRKRGLIAVIILLLNIAIASSVDYPTHSTLYTNEIKPVSDPPAGSGITASTTVTINAAGQITRFNYGGYAVDIGGNAKIYSSADAPALLIGKGAGLSTSPIFRVLGDTSPENEVFRIQRDGKVGIGTANPSATLYVGSGEVQFPASAGRRTHFNYPDGRNYIRGETYLDSGDPVYVAGKVGIGTVSPAASLHVAAENNNNDGTIKLGARAWLQHRDSGNTVTSLINDYNSDSAKLDFRMKGTADGNAVMTILGNGKVGIGTANPSQKLDVAGTVNAQGFTVNGQPLGNGGVQTESDPTVLASVKDGVSWSEVSGIPAGFADGVDDTGTGGITSEQDPQVSTLTSGKWCRSDGSAVQCDQNAPINSQWTTGTGNIYYNGKVGIGDIGIPQQQLDIGGQGIHITGNTNSMNEYDGLNFMYHTNSLVSIISAKSSTATSSNPAGVSELRFKLSEPQNTANPHKDVMTLKGTGNVGIGTTTPQAKLDVVGDIKLSGKIQGIQSTVKVASGTVSDNTNIPIPLGFVGSECKAIASKASGTNFWDYGNSGRSGNEIVSIDANFLVRCYENIPGVGDYAGTCNYLIICVKG